MTRHEELRELVEIYALGALEGKERDELESHLASGCSECETALHEARLVAGELAFALPPVAPPPPVRERLLAQVRKDSPEATPTSRATAGVWPWLAAAASILLALGLGLYARSLQQRIRSEALGRQSAEAELQRVQSYVDSFIGPWTQTVSLSGQGPASGARATAFLDREKGRLFLYVYNLPPPPPGRTYQLWLIVGKKPVSAGVFHVKPTGEGRIDGEPFAPFDGAVTVAVTEEPEGGVPQPTGPMVLLGT